MEKFGDDFVTNRCNLVLHVLSESLHPNIYALEYSTENN